jgi:long-chain acyl-CoA synthetase
LKDDTLKQAILNDLNILAVESKFTSLEKPGQIHLRSDPFTIENEFLTPTMKMKRNIAKKMLEKEINELYALPT